jgi:hypothetical protein
MSTSRTFRPGRAPARGQALVISVLMMLVITVTVFLTFAIGARTRRKIQLQAVADSTAYSLAVVEARAFNFYAWSNRALVAHNVSILSVHAHQSYLSFYEDMLAATANNYRKLAKRVGAVEAEKLEHIADLYLNSDFDPVTGHGCVWRDHKGELKCSVDNTCVGDAECEYDDTRKRGAKWFHDVWHYKDASNSCYRLVEGSRDHFAKVVLLRAHQLGVESQLELMMTGEASDMMPTADRERLKMSTKPGLYWDLEDKVRDLPRQSLAQHLAWLSDRNLTAHESAGRVSLGYYRDAVDNGMRENFHRDYDEILSGTRFPDFISQRGFQNDVNWRRLGRVARRIALTVGMTPGTDVTNEGSARMLKVGAVAEDPGQDNGHNPMDHIWPPRYSSMAVPAPYTRPRGGVELARAVHKGDHGPYGLGESDGIAAEDHGSVLTEIILASGAVLRARTAIDPGRNGVWGDPHDYNGPDDHSRPGDNTTHSTHIFHADLAPIPGHGVMLGASDTVGSDGPERGVYRGHMRFKLARNQQPNDLWRQPRTLSLITRPAKERTWPWDFHFTAEIPGPVSFTTLQSEGDARTDNTMAALAGGLVYFHKPPNSGEEYREPPNLWNPFWRAKLHQMKQEDAERATRDTHRATYLQLLDLHDWNAVNY